MPATGSERRSSAVVGGMDSSRRLSASSDGSLPERDRQFLQENVETIPTRLPKLTSSKPAANPLQFIKVGPCDLYRSAQEQIRKVEEVKKIKQKRDEAEDWQSNLDSWKNSRRKRQEHIIERVVEVKKLELEEFDRNRRRSKTFNEMMEERTNRGRKVSLVVYKDDDDKDLSDLGIGGNSASKSNGCDSNENLDMVGNDDANLQRPVRSDDINGLSDSSDNLHEPQEFTYEQAIQGYVNFAETRVKAKTSSKNEQSFCKDENWTAKSQERPNDVGKKKEKTPPPVAPKPRKYSLKLEDKVPNTERKNSLLDGNDNVVDNGRKLSLPQVDVLKRREVFEKSLASKEKVPKNKPTELLETKSVKERLSCLGINVSGISGKNKSVESEIKTSRQPNLAHSPKQVDEECTNITRKKMEENGENESQNSQKIDPESLKECNNEHILDTTVAIERSVDSVQEQLPNSETSSVSSEKKLKNCNKLEKSLSCSFHENSDLSDDDKCVDSARQNWQNTESSQDIETGSLEHNFSADRWKLHRSLDSLDRNYCEDMGTKLLERVQSLDVLEQFNGVRDYPLSSSSVEMLGSSNGGDTDREDSGIHTADVSCSISQTDEAVEYGDPSTEIPHAFPHLILENNVCSSEVPENKLLMEEHEFSGFQQSSTTGIQAPVTSRELTESFILSERKATVDSGVKSNVSSHTQNVENVSNNLAIATMDTSTVNGDGFSSISKLESNISSENVNTNTNISSENVGFLSDDNGNDELCKSSVYEAGEVVSQCTSVDDVNKTVFENQHETLDEEKIHTKFASDNGEDVDPQQHENCSTKESNVLPDVCCIDKAATVDKPFSNPETQIECNVEAIYLDLEPSFIQNKEKPNPPECTLTESTRPEDVPKVKLHHETCDSIDESHVIAMCETSDRNSVHISSITDTDTMVVVLSGVTDVKEEEMLQKGADMVQKEDDDNDLKHNPKNDFVDLDSGDGKLNTLHSFCDNNKDIIVDFKESKEAVNIQSSNDDEINTVRNENLSYVQHGSKVEEKADAVVLNERAGDLPKDGYYVSSSSDYSVHNQPNVAENAENCLSTAVVTKDFRNLRLQESPSAVSDDLITSAVEVTESQKVNNSQIKCEILPLNLSSEVEIVAGLTFPLGPVTLAEPPKEKPPPPPPSDISDDEQMQKDSGLKRMDSTKRIKKEIRRKRTNFLGIEGNADDSYLEAELRVAPPPDMTTFLMEEQRLQKQLYRQSICSESDSNLGETTDSRDSGVEMEKGNSDDIWATKQLSTPEDLSANHSRQNSEIYGNTSIASEDDEIAKKEREIIEILEKEEQWRNGHSPHNHEENIGEELSEKLWQLEQENLRLAWEKEAKRREFEETVQRHEEEMRQKEREREIKQQEALFQMDQRRAERGVEVSTRHKEPVPIPQGQQQWVNKARLSLQDVSAIRHPLPRHSAQFPSRSMLPEHCQSLPDLLQKPQDHNWKQHSPAKSVPPYHNEHVQQDWRENESYNRNNWVPAYSPVNQQNEYPATGGNHIQGQPMTRLTFQALSAVPRSRLIPTENWIQAKRKPESKRGTFNSQHWIIQEAEQRRITEQQQRNAMASQKMPTSQLSQPLNWMHQQPQQKKPLPDAVISTLTQRVQNKVDNKKYINRPRIQESPNREQVVGHHNVLNSPRPNGNQGTMNNDQTEKMLSVSGKKKCSHCGEELGRGAAMIIESLRLFYHIDCFKCCVCHIQLGDGLMGTDVRVRNNKLHCHNCYSSEDGVKFSCV